MSNGRWQQIAELTGEHLVLVVISILIACAIAIPAAILLSRKPRPRRAAVAIANILQTIPSLALFGFLIPIPLIGGIGKTTAIVALIVYALLPLLRNTLAGILGVDPAVRESAVAMGLTPGQVLRMVEESCAELGVAPERVRHAGVSSCGPFVIREGLVELAAPNICGGLAGPARGKVAGILAEAEQEQERRTRVTAAPAQLADLTRSAIASGCDPQALVDAVTDAATA